MSASSLTIASTADLQLLRAEWQRTLFGARPRRADLLRLRGGWSKRHISIRVHRNHPFEYVASVVSPFLAYAQLEAELSLGSFDDSLSSPKSQETYEAEIVWLDLERYDSASPEALADWLVERCRAWRVTTDAPILVADWPAGHERARAFNSRIRKLAGTVPALRVCPLSEVEAALGADFWDARLSTVGATRMSDVANVEIARRFGLCWIPAVVAPRLKAVVFDLDHTLWAGSLGEDGVGGVVVTEGHAALQRRALALADSGLLLGLVSRNEDEDVQRFFARRSDMPLSLARISARAVSWESKATGLAKVAKKLRIGPDAILFVDDNPGELAAVAAAHSQVWTLHASDDTAATLRALELYPGLLRWEADAHDALRAADLAASDTRESLLATAADPMEYLASLDVTLRVSVDPVEERTRLSQLCAKTNQFNLALRRLGETEIERRLSDCLYPVVAIWLSDRLSDSGLIAALFAHRIGRTLVVEELCVSCRALARGIEDGMVTAAVNAAIGNTLVDTVVFRYTTGPRNGPGRGWLVRFADAPLVESEGTVAVPWDRAERARGLANLPIRLIEEALTHVQ